MEGACVVLRTASVRYDQPHAVHTLAKQLGPDELDLVVLLVTPEADFDNVIREASECCRGVKVIGCTTAGEISASGYTEGEIVAVGFPRHLFISETMLISNLDDFDAQPVIDRMIQTRNELSAKKPEWANEFNFMIVDGLSTKEDKLASELAFGLGSVPLFGGSAGDGAEFGETFVLYDGCVHSNAAILAQFRTRCPIKVFKTDHLIPTENRMVVTKADPARRVVQEINAEPAAREYARILGKDPEQLTTFTFAAHPVVVRIGGQHHVRSIQRVAENGDLVFFSAIDEGLVLTLAEPMNMVEHLEREMNKLAEDIAPSAILACDCILRRMEAQQSQMAGALSRILQKNNVVGFSTYGEQINSMHVNQTLTGVAIYPPEES